MKFDTVIIGGGLSGLLCGIKLSQQGQKCAIISSGQSALHFSSGSFDLLNKTPEGKNVENPIEGVKDILEKNPNHPYSKLGLEKYTKYTSEAKEILHQIGIQVYGTKNNHYRITPIGELRPTWLTISDFASSESDKQLPWKKVAIFNINGFLDFYPQFIADSFIKLGTECEIHQFSIPAVDRLHRNPTEIRSTNLARVLDKKENRVLLTEILQQKSKNADVIMLPAVIGMQSSEIVKELSQAVGKHVMLVPTMPPSSIGVRTQEALRDYFIKLGGVYMLGDSIHNADFENGKVKRIYSVNHGNIPFLAKNYVLATGSFFSQGLVATVENIYEPVFDLDVAQEKKRQTWYSGKFFDKQGYQEFGVKTNSDFNAIKNGTVIDNLYVAGAILEAFDPLEEGSGAGVSILSALSIADNITRK